MNKATKANLLSNVYSGLISGGVFVGTFFLLDMGLLLSLGFTAAGYVASYFLVFPSKQKQEAAELEDMVREVLTDGEGRIKAMRALSYKVKNQMMQLKINEMCDIGTQIFDTLKQKPHQVRSVEQFSSYYLDTTARIIRKYIELSSHKSYSQEIEHALKKVESTLDNTKLIFQKQLTQLLQDDMMNLDAEMSVLEEALELEGLDIKDEDQLGE